MKRRLTTPEQHAAKRRQTAQVVTLPRVRHSRKAGDDLWIESEAETNRITSLISHELEKIADPEIARQQTKYLRGTVCEFIISI